MKFILFLYPKNNTVDHHVSIQRFGNLVIVDVLETVFSKYVKYTDLYF